MGKILYVDLSSGKISEDAVDSIFARKYLGGNGFAAKIFSQYVDPEAEPFGESNALIFSTGPMNGTNIWGTGRGHAVSISPLTGLFADSNYGGDFASMVKSSGFDAIIITGKASSPVYISVSRGTVSIKDGKSLWGKSTLETIDIMKNLEGRNAECAVIGPAGENLVYFAGIICSGKRISAAGRCGLGAVLGSKNCKGIVLSGENKTEIYKKGAVDKILKERFRVLKDNTGTLTRFGTPFLVKKINDLGKLGTRNNSRETFAGAEKICGEAIEENYKLKNIACGRCPVACGKNLTIKAGRFAGRVSKMAEYESIYALGSMLEIDDMDTIFNAGLMCDLMGLDTVTMGVTLSFAAECFESGFTDSEFPANKMLFGGDNDILEHIKNTALRNGYGDVLAQGSERLAHRFGDESKKFLYSVKGLEIAGHSARGLPHMGLAYATSTRGGSHHDARPVYYDPEMEIHTDEIVKYCIDNQHYTSIGDSLVMCRFIMERGFGREINETLCSLINSVTGFDYDVGELNIIGERIYNMERLINAKRGLDRKMDNLPGRVTDEPIPHGKSKGMYCPGDKLENMLDLYYNKRGWDENGIPASKKIDDLGIKL